MYCTICERPTDHVAASCPRRPREVVQPRWYDIVISLCLIAALLFGWVKQALA